MERDAMKHTRQVWPTYRAACPLVLHHAPPSPAPGITVENEEISLALVYCNAHLTHFQVQGSKWFRQLITPCFGNYGM